MSSCRHKCDICYETGDCDGRLTCGHRFHQSCLEQFRMISQKCPTCQEDAELVTQPDREFSWRDPFSQDREGTRYFHFRIFDFYIFAFELNMFFFFQFSLKCSICLDGGNLEAKLQCGHSFHPKCITDWRNMGSGQCPNCRGPIQFS